MRHRTAGSPVRPTTVAKGKLFVARNAAKFHAEQVNDEAQGTFRLECVSLSRLDPALQNQ